MSSHSGNKPSAPPAPDPTEPPVAFQYQPPPPPPPPPRSNHDPSSPYAPSSHAHSHSSSSGSFGSTSPPQGYGYYPHHHQPPPPTNALISFPQGTHPDVIRSFQMVDRNQNGYIEEMELQEALAWNYQRFSRETLRLLIFLFRNPRQSSSIIGCFFLFYLCVYLPFFLFPFCGFFSIIIIMVEVGNSPF